MRRFSALRALGSKTRSSLSPETFQGKRGVCKTRVGAHQAVHPGRLGRRESDVRIFDYHDKRRIQPQRVLLRQSGVTGEAASGIIQTRQCDTIASRKTPNFPLKNKPRETVLVV